MSALIQVFSNVKRRVTSPIFWVVTIPVLLLLYTISALSSLWMGQSQSFIGAIKISLGNPALAFLSLLIIWYEPDLMYKDIARHAEQFSEMKRQRFRKRR